LSVEDDKHSGRPSTNRMTENVEKIQELTHWRLSPNNPWARRHLWDQLWRLSGELNRKF
jgi:hypothetical protein